VKASSSAGPTSHRAIRHCRRMPPINFNAAALRRFSLSNGFAVVISEHSINLNILLLVLSSITLKVVLPTLT
jgi:hypothetical protein